MSSELFTPDDLDSFSPVSLRVRLSDASVDQFARLTGDVSRLHVDDAFARRSAYGRRIVHGMLPLAYLPLLPALCVPGQRAFLVELAARFVGPVFPGDVVSLRLESARAGASPDTVIFGYTVRLDGASDPLTIGSITVLYEDAPGPEKADSPAEAVGLMQELPVPTNYRFDDLDVGVKERPIDFEISRGSVAALHALLQEGVDLDSGSPVIGRGEGLDLPSLLQALLLSTSVGVSLPGNASTFLDFDLHLPARPVVGARYRLSGAVTGRSKITRIVKKRVLITSLEDHQATLDAKVSVLVNDAALGAGDRPVVVTGASRELGETVAGLVGGHGAKVVASYDQGEARARKAVEGIVGSGGVAIAISEGAADGPSVRVLGVFDRTETAVAGRPGSPASGRGVIQLNPREIARKIVDRLLDSKRKRALKARLAQLKQWWVTSFFSYDAEDLKRSLSRAGIASTDSLMVHANFIADSGLRGGPPDVVEALVSLVGSEGNLMMVSIPFQESAYEYLQKGKTFKVAKTVSMMGLVTEAFRRREGTVRSLHPTHPVLTVGKDAEWLAEGHEKCLSPCGDGSPYDKFRGLHGKILCFDVDFGAMTFFHHVEDVLKDRIPFELYEEKVFAVECIDADGEAHTVKTYAFNRSLKRMLSKLESYMDERGLIHRGRVGNSRYILVSADDMVRCHTEMVDAENYPYDV